MTPEENYKKLFKPLRLSMYDFNENSVRKELETLIDINAIIHLSFPLNDTVGPDAFYDLSYKKLFHSFPDLERRDYIVISGRTEKNFYWVGTCGIYCGTFINPFLDIPPTGHLSHMRFHEFFKFENNKITEVQAIWDIPELMMQAKAWPMAPSLGREWCVPGPSTLDGINEGKIFTEKSSSSLDT